MILPILIHLLIQPRLAHHCKLRGTLIPCLQYPLQKHNSFSSVSTTGVNSTPTSSTCTCSTLGNTLSNISTPVSRPIDNPLVSAGLIPAEMADILETPLPDAASIRKRTKRITGARDLTAEDYREMLVQNKRSKEELEQQKQKRIEERERKKL